MQLRYNKTIKKRIITIELETINFSSQENRILDQFGEPIIKFEKIYKGNFPVHFEKKIRTGFKIKVKFDGTKNIECASEAANEFFESIQEILKETMSELVDKATDSEFDCDKGIVTLKY